MVHTELSIIARGSVFWCRPGLWMDKSRNWLVKKRKEPKPSTANARVILLCELVRL